MDWGTMHEGFGVEKMAGLPWERDNDERQTRARIGVS
jgi:hypothetical protein